jgi:hypothetical protein
MLGGPVHAAYVPRVIALVAQPGDLVGHVALGPPKALRHRSHAQHIGVPHDDAQGSVVSRRGHPATFYQNSASPEGVARPRGLRHAFRSLLIGEGMSVVAGHALTMTLASHGRSRTRTWDLFLIRDTWG